LPAFGGFPPRSDRRAGGKKLASLKQFFRLFRPPPASLRQRHRGLAGNGKATPKIFSGLGPITERTTMKSIVVFLLGLFAVAYLLNPGAGFFELLPDNLPFVGNLDEAAAAALLVMCLKYFGFDLPALFRRDEPRRR
jgi:hypothetical protein